MSPSGGLPGETGLAERPSAALGTPDARRDLCGTGDVALVCAITRGNHDALAEIYARHSPRVHGLALRICGQDRAEDIVQDVFLQLWHKPERYHPDRGSLQSFLLMQAHSRAVDSLRSETSRRARESRQRAQRDSAVGADIEAAVLGRLVDDGVARLLATLADDERHPIVLAYLGGHTYREVATMLEQPEGTIKSRIRKGLRRLRAQLAQADQVPGTSILVTGG